MSKRSYDGPALDGTVQYITERPALDSDTEESDDSGETVYATDPEKPGEETAKNVPVPDETDQAPERSGQTTLTDWGERA